MNMGNMGMTPDMFGGFGGPGMGMDSMNMGMGFSPNQSGYMGWNGQPGWNIAQDNFNPMTNGIGAFGANAGYHHPISGGYDHFNSMTPQQYPNNNFPGNHFRGQGNFQRGQGRGSGRGRGDYGTFNGNHAGFQNQSTPNSSQHQIEQPNGAPHIDPGQNVPEKLGGDLANSTDHMKTGEEISTEAASLDDQVDEFGRNVPAAQGETSMDVSDEKVNNANAGQEEDLGVPETVPLSDDAGNIPMLQNSNIPPRGPAALVHPEYAHEYAGRGRGNARGGFSFRGRGSNAWSGVAHSGIDQPQKPLNSTEALGQGVAGAPTAPKALRQGLPNTGYRRGGFGVPGRGDIITTGKGGTEKPER